MASKTVDEYIDCARFQIVYLIQVNIYKVIEEVFMEILFSYFLEVIEIIVKVINYLLILVIFMMNILDVITLKMYI
jgi:hypothetical protein